MAARELLRRPGLDKIVQVELDSAVIELARTTMRGANGGSLDNPRVHIVTDDAMSWLRGHHPDGSGRFDAVIVDLPDPDTPVLGRLYSAEFYALAARVAARRAHGRAGGQPVFHPRGILAARVRVAARSRRAAVPKGRPPESCRHRARPRCRRFPCRPRCRRAGPRW